MAEDRANPSLPDHLIASRILPCLPAKSIGRFRCVSKPWRSLLSSSKFIKSHLQRHSKDPEQILQRSIDCRGINSIILSSRSVSRLFTHEYQGLGIYHMSPSCNGLFLALLGKNIFGNTLTLLINPVTRESYSVCEPITQGDTLFRFGMGVGYDKSSDDYKVISVSRCGDAEVYSVRAKTWRSLVAKFPYTAEFDQYRHSRIHVDGVYLDGNIYWRGGYNSMHLVAFDVVSEEFKEVQLPSSLDGIITSVKICVDRCVLDGFLGVGFVEAGVYHVWVMKENGAGESWTNMANIGYPEGPVDGHIVGTNFRVLCLHGEDEIMTKWNSGKFFTYNLRSDNWGFWEIPDLELLSYDELLSRYEFRDQVTPFRGSLVSQFFTRIVYDLHAI